jgi:uncharacterized protein (DUF608 family)
MTRGHDYNSVYRGENLNRIAFPMGGIGAGMICLEGTGALSHLSIRNEPGVFNEPRVFSALSIQGEHQSARVLEGPVPNWKVFGNLGTGNGAVGATYGLPRFAKATFEARFPFCQVTLKDEKSPVEVKIIGWSPFIPQDADNSSLPVAALEYTFLNTSDEQLDAVFSFNAFNFMAIGPTFNFMGTEATRASVLRATNGFILWQPGTEDQPFSEGAFSAMVDAEDAKVDCAWFRGGWFDAMTMAWKNVLAGTCEDRPPITEGMPSPGGSIYVPISLAPGVSSQVNLMFSWYVPHTRLRTGSPSENSSCCACDVKTKANETHKPWYAGRFDDINEVTTYWRSHYDTLREKTQRFTDCFYDTTLPPEVVEAVASNLTILKSPTVLRQADGRLWCWEGCCDSTGCCPGSCTHVWNYAQAIPHLFPDLERTLRETELHENQNEEGHQAFRAFLPIRPCTHDFHSAADGQLGGIMKVYREWRISGNTQWLRSLWPKVKNSLDYCIKTWDPDEVGALIEPHHNTYDIEFWGPNGMLTSFYLGALKAAVLMGETLGADVTRYRSLLAKGRQYMESQLYNGEYFIQKVVWEGLRAGSPTEHASFHTRYSPEALEILEKEAPKYQYGNGCLSDGILGAWLADVCGVGDILDQEKVRSNLKAIYKYNLKHDLSEHANPQRPTYALGKEGGLLLCTWPHGDELSLPFVYSNEVWTGIEYQVASYLMLEGMVEEGLDIVRTCRDRYDGTVRNPFNEYECGHWYARALASYALIYGLTGIRYDAVEKALYLRPRIQGDFRSFLATATDYGTVGVKDGKPFYEIRDGDLEIKKLVYEPVALP